MFFNHNKNSLSINWSEKKPYTKPEIIHEAELETHAGTPIPPAGLPPGIDGLPNP